MSKIQLPMVGADPEFGLLEKSGDETEFISADGVIEATKRFGLDGCDSIAELRPEPSTNPAQVVANIHRDMITGYYSNAQIRHLYWKAGCSVRADNEGPSSIGGHIHLGMNKIATASRVGNKSDYFASLIPYLDTYLGQIGRLLENTSEARDRNDLDYGYLGDYRMNGHGVEYRTLGSWITSPRVAEGVLSLAQTVAYQHIGEYIKYGRDWVENKTAKLAPYVGFEFSDYEGHVQNQDEYSVAIGKHRKKFPALREEVRNFQLYKRYEPPIEFLFTLIEKRKTWFPGKDVDVKAAWGISNESLRRHMVRPQKILPEIRYEDIWKRAEK